MPLKQIGRDLADGKLHQALLRCWLFFRDHHPAFQAAEKIAMDMAEQHSEQKEKLYDLLLLGDPLTLRNRKYENPLALMEALDQFLFERYASHRPAPPCLLSHGKEKYFIYRRVGAYGATPRHAEQTGHLQSRLRHHWIIPARIEGIKISIKSASAIQTILCAPFEADELSVLVCAFPDGVTPKWLPLQGNAWISEELTDPETRWASALGAIKEAARQGAHIVVLPELSISPILRRRISEWLDDEADHPFLLVLPGSFHEEKEGKVYNTAALFGRSGKEILSHKKLTTFSDKDKREGTQTGDSIELLDTPLGLIGIPICLDFCQEGSPFNRIWLEIGPEWLLVPAFGGGGSIHGHRRRAESLQRAHGTVSAVANQNPDGKNEDHGFICHGPVDSGVIQGGSFAWILSRIKKKVVK
jgi:predicted amidohydrolase